MITDILVADDDSEMREMFRDIHLAGACVYIVEDGMQLVNEAGRRAFNVIFSDYNMPGMHGPEAVRIIRHGGLNRNTPIIMMTGESGEGFEIAQREAQEAGVDEVIRKPFVFPTIRDLVAKYTA